MMNDKMVAAITKAVGKEVEIKSVEQDEKNIIAKATADGKTYDAVLSERKNQYGAYYRVMSLEEVEQELVPMPGIEKLEELKEEYNDEPNDEIDEAEAMANLQAAQKFSEAKKTPVYVMSNGKRTTVVKTDANKARHEKYGYWTAAIFENGIQVSA